MEELLKKIEEIRDKLEWTTVYLGEIHADLNNIYDEISIIGIKKNCINDIESLKREMRRDGLYSAKMQDFLENFMKFYNH